MNYEAIQALKAAVKGTLLVTGIGLLLLGVVAVGVGMFDPLLGPDTPLGLAWLVAGAILTVFSRLAPPPTSGV